MNYTNLTNGKMFMFEKAPYIVVSSEFHRMQARKAVVRTTIRNLITGQLLQKTFTASDKFDPAPIDEIDTTYLYKSDDMFVFMEDETFEQYEVSTEIVGENGKYLIENIKVTLTLFDGSPVDVKIPPSVELKVIDAPPALKGNSVSNSYTSVICENNVTVSVPLFIKEDDIIKINTQTGEYLERVKQ